jgi:hypothetical protein
VKRIIATTTTFALSTLLAVGTAAPASAARCVSGQEVRQQVSAFVHDLRDDEAPATRKAVRLAFVESVRTARGAEADSPEERRGLGHQIRVLARQLGGADEAERAALKAAIHALQEQKRADHVTERDERKLRKDVRRVERALVDGSDTRGEGRQVAAFVHDLMAQFDC